MAYDGFDSTNSTCQSVLLNLACYFEFPPCDSDTSNVIPMCLESCDVFSALVDPCLSAMNSYNPFVQILREINCSDPFSYLPEFVIIDNTTCVDASELSE